MVARLAFASATMAARRTLVVDGVWCSCEPSGGIVWRGQSSYVDGCVGKLILFRDHEYRRRIHVVSINPHPNSYS